ncbi:MAG: sugar ABC transporter permease [Clostridia bacterium]|nr:sugar ABC transporter permease [Clostridia bacterium]
MQRSDNGLGIVKKKNGMASMRFYNRVFLVAMLTIPIVHWFIFWLYLNLQSILMAFQIPTGDWSMLNFRVLWIQLTSPTSDIILAVKNTFMWFGLQTFIIFPFTIALNYFFFKKIPGYKTFRVLLYIPGLLSSVAVSAMVKQFVMPNGPLGVILKACGMETVPLFFSNSKYANGAMVIYTLWLSWGSNMLLLGGTFARVPQEVLEAAKLDGCGPMRELVQLILPMISSTLITMIILRLTGLFSSSGPLLLFTAGKYETLTLAYWIFEYTMAGSGNYNTVAATGLVFTAIAVPLILTIRWLLEKIPVVEY